MTNEIKEVKRPGIKEVSKHLGLLAAVALTVAPSIGASADHWTMYSGKDPQSVLLADYTLTVEKVDDDYVAREGETVYTSTDGQGNVGTYARSVEENLVRADDYNRDGKTDMIVVTHDSAGVEERTVMFYRGNEHLKHELDRSLLYSSGEEYEGMTNGDTTREQMFDNLCDERQEELGQIETMLETFPEDGMGIISPGAAYNCEPGLYNGYGNAEHISTDAGAELFTVMDFILERVRAGESTEFVVSQYEATVSNAVDESMN